MSTMEKVVAASLVGVIVSLLLVGVVSATPVRHIIQVVPATLVCVAVMRRWSGATYAAMPVFILWLPIMVAIWLFVLGISHVLTGHFTVAEIVLTITTGIACVCGLLGALRVKPRPSLLRGAAGFALLAVLQVAALWLSLQPAFSKH